MWILLYVFSTFLQPRYFQKNRDAMNDIKSLKFIWFCPSTHNIHYEYKRNPENHVDFVPRFRKMVSLFISRKILAAYFIVNHFAGHSLEFLITISFFSSSNQSKISSQRLLLSIYSLQMGKINYSIWNRRRSLSKAVIFLTIDN